MNKEMLQLSKKELRQLTKFSQKCLKDLRREDQGDAWYGVGIDKREFDLNLYDDEDGNVICTAYECEPDGEGGFHSGFATNSHIFKRLWSVKR